MRVTAEAKAATRERIIDAARQLFASKGFDASTTRDIADAAGIASGTLFNYFATKEDLLACLAAEAVAGANREFEQRAKGEAPFEEALFAFVAAGMRKLKPLRQHLTVLLESALSPLAAADVDGDRSLRVGHLEIVARLAKQHRGELDAVALQLYWTLYTGVLTFWARDRSAKQEDTLALLDQSLSMFVGWLEKQDATKGG
jgi:AcrR family transcriptional regulator